MSEYLDNDVQLTEASLDALLKDINDAKEKDGSIKINPSKTIIIKQLFPPEYIEHINRNKLNWDNE